MKLLIYCAGGLGAEVYDLAVQIKDAGFKNNSSRFDEIYFVDDIRKEKEYYGAPVFNFEEIITKFKKDNAIFIIANGEPYNRKILSDKVLNAGFKLATLIHPTVIISPTAKIGEGTVVCNNSHISSRANIGKNCYLQAQCLIGHDTVINEDCVLSSLVVIAGGCNIGNQVYIGMNSSVKEKINIGDNAILSMGSATFTNIIQKGIAVGNPSRVMKYNENNKVFK